MTVVYLLLEGATGADHDHFPLLVQPDRVVRAWREVRRSGQRCGRPTGACCLLARGFGTRVGCRFAMLLVLLHLAMKLLLLSMRSRRSSPRRSVC